MKKCILTGEVKTLTPNEKGGLSIRVRNVHGDGKGSNLEFFDVYGKYAEAIKEKKIVLVGDIVSVEYEEKQVQRLDPQTGKPDGWATYKEDIHFRRTYRPSADKNQPAAAEPADANDGLNYDTY